jgi:hypothetical protein
MSWQSEHVLEPHTRGFTWDRWRLDLSPYR